MNLSPRALTTLASPEQHTFTIHNIYTGKNITCKFARETKCYYVMWMKLPTHSENQWLEIRFHKATMSTDELNLYIEDTAELKAAARADVAARIAAVKVREAAEAAPIAHDAPTFCGNCETYAKHDEMIVNDSTQILVCIDCDDELDTAARELLTTIKNVALLNYIGGHLPGYNFTPTIDALPADLVPYRSTTGRDGSPAAMCLYLGYWMVKPSPNTAVRILYNNHGEYVTHGDYNVISYTLLNLVEGV